MSDSENRLDKHEVTIRCRVNHNEMVYALEEFLSLNYCPHCGSPLKEGLV